MSREDHRVYSHLSEPWRYLGLTLDEIILGMVGVGMIFLSTTTTMRLLGLAIVILGIWVLKKLKKSIVGFNMKSYLHWQFGIRFGLDKNWPKSCYKRWLS